MQRPRISNKLFMAALAILALAGCQKKPLPGREQGQEQQQEQPKDPYFKIDLPDEYVLSYNQGGISWAVDTDITDWTATSDAEWCKPTAKAKELWLDVEDYDCRDENGYERYDPPRTCTVTVKAGTVFSKTIKIIQDTHTIITFPQMELNSQYDWITVSSEGMTVFLSPDGETRDIAVMSNAYRWTTSTEADWLTVTRVDGATLRITSKARDASVTVPRSTKVQLAATSDLINNASFKVEDAPASVAGHDLDYGDHTDWD